MVSSSRDGSKDDMISGWRLNASLQRRTPLCWLLRNGEFHSGPKRPDEPLPTEYAGWLPETMTWRELGMDMPEFPLLVASEYGSVPQHGGKLLPFLIDYRRIVEAGSDSDEENKRLRELYLNYPEYYRESAIDPNKYEAFKKLSLGAQCEQLRLLLVQLPCARTASHWVHRGMSFARPELVVQHEMKFRGNAVAACEGGPILLLLKSMCLPWFLEHHTAGPDDARLRLFEALCTIYADRRADIWNVAKNSSKQRMMECFREIYREQFTSSMYPGVTEDLVSRMFDALRGKMDRIFEIFASASYQFRAGWPDVTTVNGLSVSFLEVKTKDRLHASQMAIIGRFAKPLALDFQVWQVVPL